MLVLKFGGSSVGTAENIQKVKDILRKQNDNYIVIVSALSGTTDRLEELANTALSSDFRPLLASLKQRHESVINELITPENQAAVNAYLLQELAELDNICVGVQALKELSDRTMARMLSFGERLSSFIICQYLQQEGFQIHHLEGADLIRANGNPLSAEVDFQSSEKNISQVVNTSENYICGGFIGTGNKNERVVLGRGGSDLTGAIFARSIHADRLELWSDVNGMLNANPKVVKKASPIEKLSYQEAFELAYFGAKVLYPPAVRPVMEKDIPIYLRNTLEPDDPGTFIGQSPENTADKIIGVSSLQGISIIIISGVGLAGKKGTARRVFQVIEEAEVNVILVIQGCSEQSICLGVQSEDAQKTAAALNGHFQFEIERRTVDPIEVSNDHSIIAVVGDMMKSQVGLSGKIFASLGENGVNVTAISQGASERSISIVVSKKDEAKAINVIHERFFQETSKKIHLFVAGIGNVGGDFLNIVYKQQKILAEEHQLELIVAGIANSRKMLLNASGLDAADLQSIEENGTDYAKTQIYVDSINEMNLRNCVFIDNTASEAVANNYHLLLNNSISVVTCNKIAGSSEFGNYEMLLNLAKDKNCHFQYETSVGAALPIIKTIQDLSLSGDRIHRIQAVLSGSLNYIFNNYNGTKPFGDVVKEARDQGLTEPDPRIDLSGLDVKRKILILAREAGYSNELDQVGFESFLPESCDNLNSIEAFFEELYNRESFFQEMYKNANDKGLGLKVMADLNDGNMTVSLKKIAPDSSFFNIGGKDNIVALYTDRYKDEPLIIKGAGAGAEVTASGVFSDLIYIMNR